MVEFDLEKFLNMPIDAFDFQFMIGDVKDYLEFSENNIDLQHHRELQAIAHRKDFNELPPEYKLHLEQSADHRFKVSLPLRVRYGALQAFTTSVEWAVGYLNQASLSSLRDNRDGANLAVKVLRHYAMQTNVNSADVIDNYEALVQIRNCISHSAGVVKTYRFKDSLPVAVSRISGITIGSWHFFGDQICIERGALEPHIDQTAKLVTMLHIAMRGQGLLAR